MNKKGQISLFAFWKVLIAGVLFFPLLSIYKDFKPQLVATITNPIILLIIAIVPFAYWFGVAFLFVNTMRGNA